MQTNFSLAQLADSDLAESEKILRKCVHCGFCTATCPTYVLLGDELDSPRGRIYLVKDMLESGKPPTETVVKHLDRCLSCMSCMTTCPSGVNYMHLIDHARLHIEKTYTRPIIDRIVRAMIGAVLPHPSRFLLLLRLAKLARSISSLIPKRLRVMLMLAPSAPSSSPLGSGPVIWPAEGKRRKRVLLMQGCVQQVLAARINEATVRLLTRLGCEVIVAKGSGCCGAIAHHVGQEKTTKRLMRANVDAWTHEIDLDQAADNVDAIIVNASGCGTMVKDYAFILRNDKAYAEKSRRISELTRDVSEFVSEMDVLPNSDRGGLRVTYHSACSLQHGQEITATPQKLLATLGFNVSEPDEAHLCCGSAGTYNLMQPEIASQLRDRKVAHISRTLPDVIATGNIGCMIQIQDAVEVPVLHTVELLDWGTGGPRPEGLKV